MPRHTDDIVHAADYYYGDTAEYAVNQGDTRLRQSLKTIAKHGLSSDAVDEYFKTYDRFELGAMAEHLEKYGEKLEEILERPPPLARFKIGARCEGNTEIIEYEDKLIYIPSSYYCGVKCYEKYYNCEISRVGLNPYGNSIRALRAKLIENSIDVENSPQFVKLKGDKFIFINTSITQQPKTNYKAIIYLHRIKQHYYHAILIKSTLMTQDLLNHILANLLINKNTILQPHSNIMKQPRLKNPENSYYVYDIETSSTETEKGRVQKPEGLGFLKVFTDKPVKKSDVVGCYGRNCFIEMFKKICKTDKADEIKIYAHNGGRFDNIFVKAVKGVKILEQIKVSGTIKKLVAEFKGKKFIFLDSCAYLQASLKDCCKYFGTSMKDEFDIVNKSPEWFKNNEEWRAYMIQDVFVLGEILQKFERYLNILGESITISIGIPGIAWRLLNKTCFGMMRQRISTDPTTQQFIKSSCYGGRVLHYRNYFEAGKTLFNGKPSEGLISLDGNSLYPSAMYMGTFPIEGHLVLDKITPKILIEKYLNKDILCIVEVSIDSENSRYPLLPYRTKKGALIYRSGKFTGVYNSIDLKEALNDGMTITEVIRGIYWMRSENIFSNTVSNFYNQRAQFKKEGNGMEYVLKIALNSMYGKFLESIDSGYKFDKDDLKDDDIIKNITLLENGQCEYELGYDEIRVDKPNQIASFVLSYARQIMNNIIRQVGPENIYYSDTDSIYCPIESIKNIKTTPDLCGFKNDYGDGILIKFAYFLDFKRYYMEFNKPVGGKLFKAKFNGLNFNDKNTFINWFDSENDTVMKATKKMYKWFFENHDKLCDINIINERWKRNHDNVVISTQDLQFQISPLVRGDWPDWFGNGVSYPKKFNYKIDYTVPDYETEINKKDCYNYIITRNGMKSALPIVYSLLGDKSVSIERKYEEGGFETSYIINDKKELFFREKKPKGCRFFTVCDYGPYLEVSEDRVGEYTQLIMTGKRNNFFPEIKEYQFNEILNLTDNFISRI